MNHYKVYESIIKKAKSENRIRLEKNNLDYVYYENHHILPYCLGGEDEENNLVLLTAREHFICHKLLTYIYPKNRKIALAFHKMLFGVHNDKYKISSWDYKYARELISRTGLSQETKDKISNAHIGKHISEETKKKISLRTRGLKRSEETKKRISEAKRGDQNPFYKSSTCEILINKYGEELGNIKINEWKEKLRIANSGRTHSDETKKQLSISSHKRKYIHCKYCNKEFDPGNFGKWHGEKCKLNVNGV